MMRRIIDSSLRFPVLVAGVVLALFVGGYSQLRQMPVDSLPDFGPVYVEVQTESLGLSAVEVEQLITAPMEQLLLNGVPWLEDISSESIPGLSSIVLTFEDGTDPLEARQVVQERLAQGRDLPRVSTPPVMLQPLSSASRALMIRVDAPDLTPIELSVLARWTIKPALMGVSGVANVAIWGQREQQMQVQVDPERLRDQGVDLDQVVSTSANALWVSPLSYVKASTPGTGGFIDTPNQRLGIQHLSPITEPDDLSQVTLEGADGKPLIVDGKPLLLGDVATVVEDHQPLIGDEVADGADRGLLMVIEKFPEANVVEVTEKVEKSLDQLAPGLRGVTFDTTAFRPASFVDSAIGTLGLLLLIALLLMVIALSLLHDWRTAAVAAVTAPLAWVVAVFVLYWRDTTMNLMLATGLLAATVVLVDDAVVDVDNAKRLLRADGGRRPRAAAIVEAASQMRRTMMFALLIMLAATVPAFYVGFRHGLDAAVFGPVVLSYALALLASWAVVLLVAPVMSLLLTRRMPVRDTAPARRLAAAYAGALTRWIARPAAALALFGIVAVAGIAVAPMLEEDMRPQLRERTLLVHWQASPGTSHPEMTRVTARVADELRALPGVAAVAAHIGRAITSDQVTGVDTGELWVALQEDADYDVTSASVRGVVAGYPGIAHDVLTYGEERGTELGVGAPPEDELVVRVYGQDYDVLAEKAGEVRAALTGLDGVTAVDVDAQTQEPQISVQVDLAKAQEVGLTPGQVRRAAATLVSGIEVGSLFEQQKIFQVIVLGSPDVRHDLSAVRDLTIDGARGPVRLGDVADVTVASVPTVLRHNAVSRYVDVRATISTNPAAVAESVERALAEVDFPLEYHAEVVGDPEGQQSARIQLLGLAVASLVLMLLLFQAFLRSWKLALVALIGLPPALSGGVLLLASTDRPLDLGALLGIVVLVGVYSRNLLALFERYRELTGHHGGRPEISVVLTGARDRFPAVFTVAVTGVLMLLPVVVLGARPGLEVLLPMAFVVIGGLVTTTVMTLFVLPLMYLNVAPDDDGMDAEMDPDRHRDPSDVLVG